MLFSLLLFSPHSLHLRRVTICFRVNIFSFLFPSLIREDSTAVSSGTCHHTRSFTSLMSIFARSREFWSICICLYFYSHIRSLESLDSSSLSRDSISALSFRTVARYYASGKTNPIRSDQWLVSHASAPQALNPVAQGLERYRAIHSSRAPWL